MPNNKTYTLVAKQKEQPNPQMKNPWELDAQAFEKMLVWLDTDRNIAGQKYEAIRLRLIKIMQYRGCADGEEIADIVMDRVARKIDTIADDYQGDPTHYFLNVANKVFLESRRKPEMTELPDGLTAKKQEFIEDDFHPEYECLQKCLATLPADKREFIVSYYQNEKKDKINHHRKLAEAANVELPTLHVRAFRLRAVLQKCVANCLTEK